MLFDLTKSTCRQAVCPPRVCGAEVCVPQIIVNDYLPETTSIFSISFIQP